MSLQRAMGRSATQKRHLNIQEYQSKQLLKSFGVNTQRFQVADTPAAANAAASQLRASPASPREP